MSDIRRTLHPDVNAYRAVREQDVRNARGDLARSIKAEQVRHAEIGLENSMHDPVQKLLDDVEDARDDLRMFTNRLRFAWGVGIVGLFFVIGGWITGVVTGYIHVDAGGLCAGLIIGGLVMLVIGAVCHEVTVDDNKNKHPRKALRAAERCYHDHVVRGAS